MSPPFKLCVWVIAETQEVLNTGECAGMPSSSQRVEFSIDAKDEAEANLFLNRFIEKLKKESPKWTEE